MFTPEAQEKAQAARRKAPTRKQRMKEVRDCPVTHCPLYPHRPYQALKGRNHNDPPAA
jgi:hypothetical protein